MIVLKEFKGIFEIDKDFYETFKQCLSTDETRLHIQFVYFDGEQNTFVATDGRRLIKHTPDIEYDSDLTGFYEPAKIGKAYKLIPKDYTGNFPNWSRIIPARSEYSVMSLGKYGNSPGNPKFDTVHTIKGKMSEDSTLLSEIIIKSGKPLNFDFVTKVLKHVKEFEVMLPDSDSYKPVLFIIDHSTEYMIQPMERYI